MHQTPGSPRGAWPAHRSGSGPFWSVSSLAFGDLEETAPRPVTAGEQRENPCPDPEAAPATEALGCGLESPPKTFRGGLWSRTPMLTTGCDHTDTGCPSSPVPSMSQEARRHCLGTPSPDCNLQSPTHQTPSGKGVSPCCLGAKLHITKPNYFQRDSRCFLGRCSFLLQDLGF